MAEQQRQVEDLNHVLKVRREKLAELQAAGRDPFEITKYDVTAHSTDVKEHYEEWEGKKCPSPAADVQTCDGKGFFLQRSGFEGQHQIYVARDNIGEESTRASRRWTSAISSA